MSLKSLEAVVRWLLSSALALLLADQTWALNNWEMGKQQFVDNCNACHNKPGEADGTKRAFPAGYLAFAVQSRINNGMRLINTGPPNFTNTDPLRTNDDNDTDDTISNIVAYLSKTTFPLATLTSDGSPFNPFDAVSVELTRTAKFTLSNTGTDTLHVTSVSVRDDLNNSDVDNFGVTNCGNVNAGSSCVITVTFQPKSAGSFPRVLRITHDTFAKATIAPLSGEGLTPFKPSPLSMVLTNTEPTGTLTITDNKGDRIEVCRADANTFNFPIDYSFDAPFTLDANGCFTLPATSTLPRNPSPSITVRFKAGDVGPRNGALRVRRVDAIGNPVATTAPFFVQLQGNPGALAKVNESTLFDRPVDPPGVEVDNDNTLEREITISSVGSKPLEFDASTFKIGGKNPAVYGDYQVLPTGCAATIPGGLPKSDGSTPAPSCVLTIRFNPSEVGPRPATLTMAIPGADFVALNGNGIRGPRLAIDRNGMPVPLGSAVSFGSQTIGGLYPSIGITLANGGTLGDLEVVLPTTGSVAGFSFVAGAGCATIAPAATCAVNLHFDPSAELAYTNPFVIRTRKAGTAAVFDEFVLDLKGQGTAKAVPVLTWTDAAGTPITRVDFADTDAGLPRTSRVRLYNAGPGGATLNLANVVGLEGTNFVLDTSDCSTGRTLYENMSCDLGVQFAPGTAGLKTAAVQMASSGSGPGQLVVSGRGIAASLAAQLSVAPQPVFEETTAGSRSLASELTLSNGGNFALTVNAIEVEGPFVVENRSCPPVPFVLGAGMGCTISATFAPAAPGAATGTLRVTTDASSGPTEVPLSADAREAPDLSNGGCSMVQGDGLTDPTLWTLVLLAAAVLVYRRIDAMRKQRRAAPKRDE